MNDSVLILSIASAIVASTPILFAALGEIITNRSGVMNLGIEGMMLMGAVIGFWAGNTTGSLIVAIIIGGQLQISIGGLFAGGIIPGILIGLALMITAGVISARRGYGDVHAFQGIVPIATGSAKAAPALLIPVIILGGILLGLLRILLETLDQS